MANEATEMSNQLSQVVRNICMYVYTYVYSAKSSGTLLNLVDVRKLSLRVYSFNVIFIYTKYVWAVSLVIRSQDYVLACSDGLVEYENGIAIVARLGIT